MRLACPILILVLLAGAASTSAAEEAVPAATTSRIAATPHFEFHSDFETNLHDALIAAGAAQTAGTPERFDAGPDAACFEAMPPSARSAWQQAVDWYAEVVSSTSWMARPQYLIRMDLAGLWNPRDDERARQFLDIAESLRRAAAPAYRECRWPAQDAANRAWVEDVLRRLELHEAGLGERLEGLYGMAWHGLPIRIDMAPAVLRVGANTFSEPPHVMISSLVTSREDALEIVVHEASHTLVARDSPLQAALAAAAEDLGVEPPRDLWHPLMFHLTGQAMVEALAAAGEPAYTPYVERHRLWSGRWAPYEVGVKAVAPRYFQGEISLEEMARELVQAVSEPPD